MITKNFEEYFPLLWTVIEHKNGAFMKQNAALITGKKGYKESVELGLVEEFSVNSFPPRVAALKYAVKCANLMPEAVRLLNEALLIIEKACIACANIDAYHCGFCGREETTQEIKEFLAKLEGGADNAQNP